MKILCFILLTTLVIACSHKAYKEPHVLISTGVGDIEIALYPSKAPKTVAAFLWNVEHDVYDKGSFYRVLKNEDLMPEYNTGLIQGGIFKTDPAMEAGLARIPHESPRQTGISHISGIISMARTTPGSASSEFFICIGDQTQFDSSSRTNNDGLGYAAFGKVVKSMSIVRKIQAGKTNEDQLQQPVAITSIRKL